MRGGEKEGFVCTYYLGKELNYELVGRCWLTGYYPPVPVLNRTVHSVCPANVRSRSRAAFESEPIERDSAVDNAPGLLDGSVGHAEIVHRGCVLLYAGLV